MVHDADRVDPAVYAELPQNEQIKLAGEWLEVGKQWLALHEGPLVTVDPTPIVEFRTWLLQALKALPITRNGGPPEARRDINELLRRSERTIGVVIRRAQHAGFILTARQIKEYSASVAHGGPRERKPAPGDYMSSDLLYGSGNSKGLLQLTDGVTDRQFNDAIALAREEGNLARTNIFRKLHDRRLSVDSTRYRELRITELAESSHTADQIAEIMGLRVEGVRRIANRIGVSFADIGKTRREVDHTRIVRETVIGLEGTVLALRMLDLAQVEDLSEIEYWVTSLDDSLRSLGRFHRELKEMNNHGH